MMSEEKIREFRNKINDLIQEVDPALLTIKSIDDLEKEIENDLDAFGKDLDAIWTIMKDDMMTYMKLLASANVVNALNGLLKEQEK